MRTLGFHQKFVSQYYSGIVSYLLFSYLQYLVLKEIDAL